MVKEIPEAKSFKLLTVSVEKLPASMARQEAISGYAADRARLLLGCYRTGDANDPDTYVAAIAAILARYPQNIITAVTHPASGLPVKCNWLPTVKEVSDACEAEIAPIAAREAWEARLRDQLADRDRYEEVVPRPTYEELLQKYGPKFGMGTPQAEIKTPSEPAPTPSQLRAHYEVFSLEFKPKAKVWNETEGDHEF